MSSININVGTSANDGSGDSLRTAFISVRKMIAELYGITYTSDTQDLSGTAYANRIDHDELANRFANKVDKTDTGNFTVDCSAGSVFLCSGDIGTANITFDNMKQNQVVDLVLSGSLSSAAITFVGGTGLGSTTFNKVGTTSIDTSATNHISLICVKEDSSAGSIVNYTINTYTSDNNPDAS